jgi:hypothetical protein
MCSGLVWILDLTSSIGFPNIKVPTAADRYLIYFLISIVVVFGSSSIVIKKILVKINEITLSRPGKEN